MRDGMTRISLRSIRATGYGCVINRIPHWDRLARQAKALSAVDRVEARVSSLTGGRAYQNGTDSLASPLH
jgi:hypothetical protein